MTLRDLVIELHNWSRWRWEGLPNLAVPEPPAFEMYRAYADYDSAGWGELDKDGKNIAAAPEPDHEIDEPAAEAMHDLIWKLPNNHRGYIYDHWYLRLRVHHAKLQAAHDAILDIVNRWEGEFMERVA